MVVEARCWSLPVAVAGSGWQFQCTAVAVGDGVKSPRQAAVSELVGGDSLAVAEHVGHERSSTWAITDSLEDTMVYYGRRGEKEGIRITDDQPGWAQIDSSRVRPFQIMCPSNS